MNFEVLIPLVPGIVFLWMGKVCLEHTKSTRDNLFRTGGILLIVGTGIICISALLSLYVAIKAAFI